MPNYSPEEKSIVFLTADDLLDGGPIELEYAVDEVRLTLDAGELLDELSPAQKAKHTGQWD